MSTLGKKILAGLADAREFATSSTTGSLDAWVIQPFRSADAREFATGSTMGRRVHRVAVPERIDVKAIRAGLNMTQNEFAATFGFSISSVRNWEQGKREPEGPARVLLTVIAREPTAVIRALKRVAAA